MNSSTVKEVWYCFRASRSKCRKGKQAEPNRGRAIPAGIPIWVADRSTAASLLK